MRIVPEFFFRKGWDEMPRNGSADELVKTRCDQLARARGVAMSSLGKLTSALSISLKEERGLAPELVRDLWAANEQVRLWREVDAVLDVSAHRMPKHTADYRSSYLRALVDVRNRVKESLREFSSLTFSNPAVAAHAFACAQGRRSFLRQTQDEM